MGDRPTSRSTADDQRSDRDEPLRTDGGDTGQAAGPGQGSDSTGDDDGTVTANGGATIDDPIVTGPGPALDGDSEFSTEKLTPLDGYPITADRTRRLLLEMRQAEANVVTGTTFEVEQRYWLEEPFAYALVLHDTETGDHEYRVIEPDLDEHEAHLYEVLRQQLRDQLLYRIRPDSDRDRESVLEDQVRTLVADLSGYDLPESSLERVLYFLRRDLLEFERINPLMQDPRLEEISCNGPERPLYVYHREFADLKSNVQFPADQLQPFIKKLAQRSGKDISTADPMQGTSLPDGSRIQLELDDVAPRGENFTIRKFRETPFTPIDLVQYGTASIDQLAYLWMLVENGYSGIIAGGTGAGKTTTMNALSLFIPPKSKVVSIEDTREIQIPHDNWVATLTREGYSNRDDAGIDMYDLLRAALRKRPDYLIVGEVRGEEGRDLFQAMNTGHTTYSTLHADSVETVLNRLRNPPINVEVELIGELGFIAIQTDTYLERDGDSVGESSRVRRTAQVVEVHGLTGREVDYRPLYEWDESTDTIEQISESVHADALRERGRDPEQAFQRRRRVLSYLTENDITDYEPVSTVVQGFMTAPEIVLEQIEQDDLDLDELAPLGELEDNVT